MSRRTGAVAVALVAAAALLLGERVLQEEDGDMTEDTSGAGAAAWVGRWEKVEEEGCPAPYPRLLVVGEGGVYEAPGAIEIGSRFHSGDIRLPDEDGALLLQAANDAMVRHRIVERTRDGFTLEVGEGCRVRYRRVG